MSNYEDIIQLHWEPKRHRRMGAIQRAAQFSPFAALTGYEDALEETGRLTDYFHSPDEGKFLELEEQLHQLEQEQHGAISVTYFVPDTKKSGGAYCTVTQRVKHIDPLTRMLVLKDGKEIPLDMITGVEMEGNAGDR